jgi:hypothetical protein
MDRHQVNLPVARKQLLAQYTSWMMPPLETQAKHLVLTLQMAYSQKLASFWMVPHSKYRGVLLSYSSFQTFLDWLQTRRCCQSLSWQPNGLKTVASAASQSHGSFYVMLL